MERSSQSMQRPAPYLTVPITSCLALGRSGSQFPYLSEEADQMGSEHHLNGLTLSQNQTNIIMLALFPVT